MILSKWEKILSKKVIKNHIVEMTKKYNIVNESQENLILSKWLNFNIVKVIKRFNIVKESDKKLILLKKWQ